MGTNTVTEVYNSTVMLYSNETENPDEGFMERDDFIKQLIDVQAVVLFGKQHNVYFPIIFVVCVVGLVTNSLNIVVFTRPNMMNPVNFLLTALSAADILLLMSQIPSTLHQMAGFTSFFEESWWKFFIVLIFLETVGMMTTNWLAVAVGIFRCISIKWHLRSSVLCSMKRAKMALVLITVPSICISGLAAGTLDVHAYDTPDYVKPPAILYFKGPAQFTEGNTYLMEGIWGSLMLCHLVPTILLVIITALLVWSLVSYKRTRKATFTQSRKPLSQNVKPKRRSFKDNQDVRTTATLVVLLFLFFVNNLPDASINVAAFYGNDTRQSVQDATDVFRVFSMLNNSVSFFIYYIMSINFRKSFNKTIKDWFPRLRKSKENTTTPTATHSETCSSMASSRKESTAGVYKLEPLATE